MCQPLRHLLQNALTVTSSGHSWSKHWWSHTIETFCSTFQIPPGVPKVSENKIRTYIKTAEVDQNWIQNATVFLPCIYRLRWNAKIFIFCKWYQIRTQFRRVEKKAYWNHGQFFSIWMVWSAAPSELIGLTSESPEMIQFIVSFSYGLYSRDDNLFLMIMIIEDKEASLATFVSLYAPDVRSVGWLEKHPGASMWATTRTPVSTNPLLYSYHNLAETEKH